MTESQEFAEYYDKNLNGSPGEKKNVFRSPDKIREDIYKALGEESGIDLEVKNGYVRVTGLVDTADTIPWMIDAIRGVKGVIDVQSQVKVKTFNQ